MTEFAKLSIPDLAFLHSETNSLRDLLDEWCHKTGYTASELMSKTALHDIQWWYGKKLLEGDED